MRETIPVNVRREPRLVFLLTVAQRRLQRWMAARTQHSAIIADAKGQDGISSSGHRTRLQLRSQAAYRLHQFSFPCGLCFVLFNLRRHGVRILRPSQGAVAEDRKGVGALPLSGFDPLDSLC